MRRFGRFSLFILVCCIFLQSCTSARVAQELQSAKLSFAIGNYKVALRQILPVACEGSPQAQYAAGYMYYYGYGVHQDKESGLFWINKAASQHYLPALRALTIIRNHELAPKKRQEVDEKIRREAILPPRVENKNQEEKITLQPEQMVARHENNDDIILNALMKNNISSEEKKEVTNKEKYTFQLFGSRDLDAVKKLQTRLQLKDETSYWKTKHNGSDWYVLTYGKYNAMYQAKIAEDNLPERVRLLKPWPRRTDELRWIG